MPIKPNLLYETARVNCIILHSRQAPINVRINADGQHPTNHLHWLCAVMRHETRAKVQSHTALPYLSIFTANNNLPCGRKSLSLLRSAPSPILNLELNLLILRIIIHFTASAACKKLNFINSFQPSVRLK